MRGSTALGSDQSVPTVSSLNSHNVDTHNYEYERRWQSSKVTYTYAHAMHRVICFVNQNIYIDCSHPMLSVLRLCFISCLLWESFIISTSIHSSPHRFSFIHPASLSVHSLMYVHSLLYVHSSLSIHSSPHRCPFIHPHSHMDQLTVSDRLHLHHLESSVLLI